MQHSDLHHRTITLIRIFKTAAQNFIRNAWLSIAAMAVMVITLSIILFSFVANLTLTHTIDELNNKISISVYLKDEVTQEQRDQLIDRFKAAPNVKSVDFITKDQALEQYKDDNRDNLDLLLAISQTDNPLPASLKIKPNDANKLEEIRAIIETPDVKALQSDETSYSGETKIAVDKITQTTSFLRRAGVIAVIVFAIVSVMIIFNTIQMAIFNRREELVIMRLLGASSWYIRGPFIVETVYYGIIAAVISVAMINTLLIVPSDVLSSTSLGLLDTRFAGDYFTKHYWIILTIQLVIGIFIGAASSYIATRRYLKFKTSK